MWVAHDYRVAGRARGAAVAIGNFDGVHAGHLELLKRTLEGAAQLGLDPLVFTFEPHPTRLLAPERASALVTPLDRKLELLEQAGIPGVIVQLFDRRFAALTPHDFAREVLGGLRAQAVFVGENFRFGKDRAGDGPSLQRFGEEMGFSATVLSSVRSEGETISSSRVRKALAAGELPRVRLLLGRAFDFDGLVVHGDHRARTLGFPTANLRTAVEALPADGVYAVQALVRGEANERWYSGVMNIGIRPTFSAGRSVEVHLLDQSRDLYGRTLRIRCIERLRDEQKFDGLEALRSQISADIHTARAALAREES